MICRRCGNDALPNYLHDGLCGECLEEEYDRLKSDYIALLESAFLEIASPLSGIDGDGFDWNGWYDSNGRSTACDYGDRLCELGLWEKHPGGVGSRQWYRKIEKEKLQLAQGD